VSDGLLRRLRGSVRLRVSLLAAGVFAVALIVGAVVLLRSLERVLVDDARAAARVALARQAEALRSDGIPAAASSSVEEMNGVVTMEFGAGARTFVIAVPEGVDPADYLIAGSADSPAMVSQAVVADRLGLPSTADFLFDAQPVGGALLSTVSPLDDVQATIDRTRQALWVVVPGLVVLVGGMSWLLAGRALRPVRLMTARVASIESRSLHERVPEPQSGDEVAELARTMNQMLGRLERASETSRRLVSDASHELRTPVAVMRTELEVAQRDADADWSATSDVLLGELDRLQLLIDDLLLLARGDEMSLARNDVDLDAVVDEVTSRRRRVPVTRAPGEAVIVRGDERALGRAFDHLVANAARAATTRVAVSIERNGEPNVAIHVDDDGPGVPPDQRANVVRRFVRLDEARSRDEGGAGLGLAVASDVAAAHGGRLAIDDSPLGGARVTITLPASIV
jgi:signal transduction histidine kinase